MMPFLLTLFARWAVPERLRKPLAYLTLAVSLIALLALGKWLYDRNLIRDYEREATAEASASASAAAVEATEAVTETKSKVETTNEQARDAANRGADPLGDGLRSLRAAKASGSPAPR